jgi:hypothetical protein
MLCPDLNEFFCCCFVVVVVGIYFFSVMAQDKFVEEITNFQYSECEQDLERVYCKALNISRGKE